MQWKDYKCFTDSNPIAAAEEWNMQECMKIQHDYRLSTDECPIYKLSLSTHMVTSEYGCGAASEYGTDAAYSDYIDLLQ